MDTNFRISTKHKAVITRFAPSIQRVIPHARAVTKNGRKFHVVPHRDTETRLLNNLGYQVPAPILSHYDWNGTKPFESQKVTAELMTKNSRAYILNEMGTGKTRAALYACDFLMRQGEVNKVLIVAPLSTLTTVWEREIFDYFHHRESVVLFGSRSKRVSLLREHVDFYIINHEGLGVIEDELRDRKDINAVIIDELALLRNQNTNRWKATRSVIANRKYVWGMTGSPTPKEPVDAYGQVKLLTPQNVPPFRRQFQQETMWQLSQYKWVARKGANDIVHSVMQPSVRFLRKDCVDLPDVTYSTRDVPLSREQKKAYKEMWDDFVLEFENEDGDDDTIVAANAGVQLGKLLQIGCGFTYGRDGVVVDLDCNQRLNELADIVVEASSKVIVFVPFKYGVQIVADYLSSYTSVAVITGDVAKKERDEVFTLFQQSTTPHVLVAHPATMSHGLTLTAANTIVWFTPPYSLEICEQANARITRPGQKYHAHIIYLLNTPAEKKVYQMLRKRGNMQDALLELFKDSIDN